MEVIRHYLDADTVNTIIPLPDSFHNRRLEVIVIPAEQEPAETKRLRVEDTLRALSGAIPDEGMSLDEYRAERLNRYAVID